MAEYQFGIGKVTEQFSKPAQDFLKTLLGPATEEVGEIIADNIKYQRWKNLHKITEKARKEVEKRNIEPQRLPLKTILPILEKAGLEEEENLQDKWSNLLVSAVNESEIHPSYSEILSQLTSDEAKILDYLNETEESIIEKSPNVINKIKKFRTPSVKYFQISHIVNELLIDSRKMMQYINNLFRLNLCEHPINTYEVEAVTDASIDVPNTYSGSIQSSIDADTESVVSQEMKTNYIILTELGRNFTNACKAKVE